MVVEGEKVIRAAHEGGARIRELYLAPDAGESVEQLAPTADVRRLAAGVIERVASTVSPQSEIALVSRPEATLESITDGRLLLIGVGVQDPGNAGTMVRTALAAGASGILFTEGSVDVFSPKTVRSSAGAVFGLPVVEGMAAEDALDEVARLGWTRLATDSGGSEDLYDADLPERVAVVVGNEANGLPTTLASRLDRTVRIPMLGAAESLNVAVASAVVCFELVRRQRAGAPR
ncbi:MAG TPA: RNA methyltransferase [Acidimicrobiales bacterium]|nr:RNA methyltransferase [Acidimicrobiales bacterium]